MDGSKGQVAGRAEARDWLKDLVKYREPILSRSIYEIIITLAPFMGLWTLAWWLLSYSYWLAVGIALVNSIFLVRLFVIQHDCGHSSYFKNKHVSDWVGRVLGVITLTPYDVWKKSHAIHHGGSGNLNKRGVGDILTLTVEEYNNRTAWGRFKYRVYRNPLVLFVFGPAYIYFLQNRLPVGFMKCGWSYWVSAMATNLALSLALSTIIYFGGLMPIFLIFMPTSFMAAVIGIWLFYVQHQFEDTSWDSEEDWQVHEAALNGSSYYVLPGFLRWLTANIGLHHIHHLHSRISFYRLPEVLRDHPGLEAGKKIYFFESISCIRLKLWDEGQRKLLSIRQAKKLYGKKR